MPSRVLGTAHTLDRYKQAVKRFADKFEARFKID